jgi:hypothetical protein
VGVTEVAGIEVDVGDNVEVRLGLGVSVSVGVNEGANVEVDEAVAVDVDVNLATTELSVAVGNSLFVGVVVFIKASVSAQALPNANVMSASIGIQLRMLFVFICCLSLRAQDLMRDHPICHAAMRLFLFPISSPTTSPVQHKCLHTNLCALLSPVVLLQRLPDSMISVAELRVEGPVRSIGLQPPLRSLL